MVIVIAIATVSSPNQPDSSAPKTRADSVRDSARAALMAQFSLSDIHVTVEPQELLGGKRKVVTWVENRTRAPFTGSVQVFGKGADDGIVDGDAVHVDLEPHQRRFGISWMKNPLEIVRYQTEISGSFGAPAPEIAVGKVPLIIDVTRIAGRSPAEVARIFGEHPTPTSTDHIRGVLDEEYEYRNGGVRVAYRGGRAWDVSFNKIDLPFNPASLAAFGLHAPKVAPEFPNQHAMEWDGLHGYSRVLLVEWPVGHATLFDVEFRKVSFDD
ncbi:MAG: hypothetical protein ACR2OG_15280 [Gemmatimonadaceae bacterium]